MHIFRSSNMKWSISPMQLEKIKSRHKLSKSCIVYGKNGEISGPYNFWKPQKAISLMFESKTVGSYLVWKLKWGSHSPLAPPVATPLISVWLVSWYVFLTAKSLFTGHFEIALVFSIAPFISESLLGNTPLLWESSKSVLAPFNKKLAQYQ